MTESPWIVAVDLKNFEEVVVKGSVEQPVLIDFWAPWCGPCKTLTPILERVAKAKAGAFLLAKIDVDQNPDLAAAFRVQSVPTVLLLAKARPVDGFTGARSEAEVLSFLEPWLGEGGAEDGPDVVQVARDMEADGQRAEGIATLQEVLENESDFVEARIELARMLLDEGRPEEAGLVFARVSGEDLAGDAARAVQARLAQAPAAGEVDELAKELEARPDDLGLRLKYGRALFVAGRHEEGMEEMYQVALRDLDYNASEPRKALLEAFETLGESNPLTLDFRQRLSILICS